MIPFSLLTLKCDHSSSREWNGKGKEVGLTVVEVGKDAKMTNGSSGSSGSGGRLRRCYCQRRHR